MSDAADHDRLVTISFFVKEMMGKKNRSWYYRHWREPGFPPPIKADKTAIPMLSYAQCRAYIEGLKDRALAAAPKRRGRPPKQRAALTPPA